MFAQVRFYVGEINKITKKKSIDKDWEAFFRLIHKVNEMYKDLTEEEKDIIIINMRQATRGDEFIYKITNIYLTQMMYNDVEKIDEPLKLGDAIESIDENLPDMVKESFMRCLPDDDFKEKGFLISKSWSIRNNK